MHEVNLNKWNIPQKETIKPHLSQIVFESEDFNFLILFTEIQEWSLMKYCSTVEIYRNKLDPEIIFKNNKSYFLYDLHNQSEYLYDWSIEGIICFRQLINSRSNKYSYPYVIFNIYNLQYAKIEDDSLRSLTKSNLNTLIGMKPIFDQTGNIKEEEQIIFILDEMTWLPFNTFI